MEQQTNNPLMMPEKGETASSTLNTCEMILSVIPEVDFQETVFPQVRDLKQLLVQTIEVTGDDSPQVQAIRQQIDRYKVSPIQRRIAVCDKLVEASIMGGYGICVHNEQTLLYNGAFWLPITESLEQKFLVDVQIKMGIDRNIAIATKQLEEQIKQFHIIASIRAPISTVKNTLINLKNGTLEFTSNGALPLRSFNPDDFLKYQLPFNYDETATKPLFQKYLDKVLPESDRQNLLSEYLGYLFLKNGQLKLEKVLMLFGDGHNGKSVLIDVISALLGNDNISIFSPQELMSKSTGPACRAEIENKLVNFSSECSKEQMKSDLFKKIASGEPLPARRLYGDPFMIENYSKLIFSCNQWPLASDLTDAYFRRFHILRFKVKIEKGEKDVNLAKKIIASELSGILNWMLAGLDRLLKNKEFTIVADSEDAIAEYRKASDNVLSFIDEKKYLPSDKSWVTQVDVYKEYERYCADNNFMPGSSATFAERMQRAGIQRSRQNPGYVFYIAQSPYEKFRMPAKPTRKKLDHRDICVCVGVCSCNKEYYFDRKNMPPLEFFATFYSNINNKSSLITKSVSND